MTDEAANPERKRVVIVGSIGHVNSGSGRISARLTAALALASIDVMIVAEEDARAGVRPQDLGSTPGSGAAAAQRDIMFKAIHPLGESPFLFAQKKGVSVSLADKQRRRMEERQRNSALKASMRQRKMR